MSNIKTKKTVKYTLHCEGEPSYGNEFTIYAKDYKGKQISFAGFFHSGSHLYPQDVEVDYKHRRKGIATAMYKHAQMLTQTSVSPSENQSDDAIAFWKTFGKQK